MSLDGSLKLERIIPVEAMLNPIGTVPAFIAIAMNTYNYLPSVQSTNHIEDRLLFINRFIKIRTKGTLKCIPANKFGKVGLQC